MDLKNLGILYSIGIMLNAIALAGMGTDLALRTLTLVCSKAIDNVGYFAISSHPGFSDWEMTLQRTDIKARIEKIQQLGLHFKEKEEAGYQFNSVIKMCIGGINDTIIKINGVLEETKKMQEYQETIYLNTWRFRLPDCTPQINTLTFYSDLLKERFTELEKMSLIVGSFDHIQSKSVTH